MTDFENAYSYDLSTWGKQEVRPPDRGLRFLKDTPFPVEDPNGLCALMTPEEQSALVEKNRFYIEWIDIAFSEDLEKLREIYQRVTDRWYHIIGEETFSIDGRTLKLLRYVETYYTIPPWLIPQLTQR